MGARMGTVLGVVAGALLIGTAATAAPAPRLQSATVVGDRVTLLFTAAVAPKRGRTTVTVNGRVVTPRQTTLSGRRLHLVLPSAAYSDDTVRVHGLQLRARSGARIRAFATNVANRSAAGCTQELGAVAPGQPSEGPTDAAMYLHSGRVSVLSVQVDYADAPPRQFDRTTELSAPDAWLREVSYGRAGVDPTYFQGVVRMAKGFGDYAFNGAWGGRKPFFQDLVLRLDGEVDFSRYDAVVVSTASRTIPDRPPFRLDSAIVAPVGQGVIADGKELRHFAVFTGFTAPENPLAALFNLMGLPTMSGNSQWDRPAPLTWHRRKLGWLNPAQTRCLRAEPLEVVLTPAWSGGGVKLVLVPTAQDRAVVLENRQPGGLDARQCRRGIVAYEVQTRPVPDPITIFPDPAPRSTPPCVFPRFRPPEPFDYRPKDSTRIANAVTFEVLEVTADGSYRLRVTR